MKKQYTKKAYEAPRVEMMNLVIECGFANSICPSLEKISDGGLENIDEHNTQAAGSNEVIEDGFNLTF